MAGARIIWMKIWAAAGKELLLLRRDRAGLLVLFVMPAVLVVVLTLVQENIMELTGETATRILYLDLDGGELGKTLRQRLSTGSLALISMDAENQDEERMRRLVSGGEYQAGIVVPAGASARLAEAARQSIRSAETGGEADLVPVRLVFDPGIMASLRTGITARLEMTLRGIALETRLVVLEQEMRRAVEAWGISPDAAPVPVAGLRDLLSRPLLVLEEKESGPSSRIRHNPVQQNVPAWALFGMFFTAIPIAVGILRERNSGIWLRLQSLPVSPLLLFTGKVAAYVGICFCQFLLIALIGIYLFPLLGLPAFALGQHPSALLPVVLGAGLAASGYGIFLGMVCTSHEQASALGPATIVAAAAIGGIMVPVYAMPPVMQRISIVSPLNWGLTAFQDLLLREGDVSGIFDDLGRLVLFFLATVLLAWKVAKR